MFWKLGSEYGCRLSCPWQIISDSGPPFPYLYSNGSAEMCLSLNSTVAILIDGDPLAILNLLLGLLNWVAFLATEGVSLGEWICFNRHTLYNMPLRRQDIDTRVPGVSVC